MSGYDIEALLGEIGGGNPCGADVSYDPEFLALEALLHPQGAGVVDKEKEAKEPSWPEIAERSVALLKRSKDLRVALYLTVALLKLEGMHGFGRGLGLTRVFLERYWNQLYPSLDDDGSLERRNVLIALSPPKIDSQDPFQFRRRVMEIPLCDSGQMGRFSFHDIQIVRGEIAVGEEERTKHGDTAVIEAAFQDTPIPFLDTLNSGVEGAISEIKAITKVFSQHAAGEQAPSMDGIVGLLEQIHQCTHDHLSRRGGQPVVRSGGTGASVSARGSSSGEIRSGQDAVACMEMICRYFEQQEPSSPVPLLLRRAQRLVSKNFMDIIADLCPGAVGTVETISGTSEQKPS
jgi:type VI secretion system protein ImpA